MMTEKRIASLKRRYGGRIAEAPKKRGPGPGGPGGPGRGPGPRGGGKPKQTKEAVKRLMSYLEKDRLGMLMAFFCVILGTTTNLAGAYMLRPIINGVISPAEGAAGGTRALMRGVAAMAGVYLISVAANYGQSRIMLTIAQNALQRIREDLFQKMQRLPLRFYDTNSNGDLMSRFTNDVDTIGNMLSSTLVQLFSGILSIIGTLILMLYTNIWLTVITLVMLPVMMKAGGFVA